MGLSDPIPPQPPVSESPPVPIVAIGASAGGLEAMSSLLHHLSSTTGLAFVYIQHLSPNHPSQLAEILSRTTSMRVLEAANQLRIQANHVYIIPPNQTMEVIDGVLTLLPRRPKPAIHLPIDQFFISLAERQRAASIAILLSGTANDGTVGLKAIKAAGGITFAQDVTAKFQGMTLSAQAEGVVDKVLPPIEIARELEWLSKQPDLFRETALAEYQEDNPLPKDVDIDIDVDIDVDIETDSSQLAALLQLLKKFIGVDFSHYKTATIRRRVIRRMTLYKLRSLPEYMDYLRQHPTEAGLLYNDLLINVTTFFRDTETMVYLRTGLLPQLLKAKSDNQPFRLWVPACSSGEEVYSLAILLMEVLTEQNISVPIQIFATDLSERVISLARVGRYTDNQLIGVSPERLSHFFTKDNDGYCISKVIRDVCVFATHNLFVDPPFSRLDLISCRNLLIYTDNVLQRKAMATFHYALNPTGYLILGKAETVGSSVTLFSQVAKNYKIYARKNISIRAMIPLVDLLHQRAMVDSFVPDNPSLPDESTARSANTPPLPAPVPGSDLSKPPTQAGMAERRSIHFVSMQHKPGQPDDLDQRVNGLLSQYTPASVVVNKDMEIIRFQGSTSLFLEPAPGRANFSLLKMARPELVFDLRNLVNKAHKTGQPATKTGLIMRVREQLYHTTIHANPFLSQNQEPLTLVVFEAVSQETVSPTAPAQLRSRRIKQLEEELSTLRDDMRSMLEEQEAGREELQSANEEIISSNEELQSINEELETSKEEIQSNNEELQTINQELQLSNDQLSEAYDYSDAIFGIIRETILVLDKDLRVRSANRAFYKTFRIETDDTIGRLLYELGNRQWDIPALRALLDRVIRQNTPIQAYEITHYFRDLGEKVLRLNARKVVRLQGQAAILLAIEDVTNHSQIQRLLGFLQSILAHAPVSIQLFKSIRDERKSIVDFQLVPLASELGQPDKQSLDEVYKKSYKVLYNATEQNTLFTRYVQVVETGEPIQLEIPYEQGHLIEWHLVSASRFDDGFLLVTSNITARKKAEVVIQEREAQLSRLVENTPDVITRWDKHRRLVFANSAFQVKTGSDNQQLLGLTNLEMGQPDEIALPYMASLQEVLDTGRPKEHYNFYSQPNGTVFFYSRMVPELAADGSVEGVLAIARDITKLNEGTNLKQAYETIQQAALDRELQANRLQTILDSAQTAILTLSPIYTRNENAGAAPLSDFEIKTVNNVLATYLGQPAAVLVGLPISRWFPSTGQDTSFLDYCRHTFLTNQPQRIDWHHATGQHDNWLDLAFSKVGDELLVTFSDFTKLKQLQQDLEKSVADLQRSNAYLEQFAYVASHDLQEPLRKIQQFGNLIQTNYASQLDENGVDLLGRMHAAASRLQVLIKDVLAYSQLSAKRDGLELVSLNSIVDDVLTDLEASITDQKARIIVDSLPTLRGDPSQLRQLFQNLLSNSLKFFIPGQDPVIRITYRQVTGQDATIPLPPTELKTTFSLLEVSDNGIGFAPDQAERIFQVFQRLHGKSQYAGTGIGLAIVQKVVENHRGYIQAEGKPGEGATFRILLPAAG